MNKHMNRRSLGMIGTVALCSVMLTACSDNDDDSQPITNDTQPGANANDSQSNDADTQPGMNITDLAGTWSTGCILDDSDDVSDGYEIETISFSAQEFTATAASFSDAGCTSVMVDDDDVDLQGTFSLGATLTTSSGVSANEIDFTYIDPLTSQQNTLLDLIAIQDGSLYLGEGDFDELLENDLEPRPVSLDLLEPYLAQP